MTRALLTCVLVLAAGSAAGQTVEMQVSEAPHFAGEPVDVQLVVDGFAGEPDPDVQIESPGGAELELVGMSPNISTSISIVNGRVTRVESVRFAYRYRFVPSGPGRYSIGPFRVRQGELSASAPAVAIDVVTVPESDQMRVRLELPETPVYPGQRVRVGIEWWFAAELRERLHRYRIRSPLFDRGDVFRFLDPEDASGGTELVLETAGGSVSLPAEVRQQRVDGTDFTVVRAERTLVPLESGTFELGRATVVADLVSSWRRDLFRGRVPQSVRKPRAEDLPRRLVVHEIPSEGRPPGFAGAIGRGFTLEVRADRSVVAVGDPIQLTLVLHGDGNLESAGLPTPLAELGLSPGLFRLPPGDVDGTVEKGAKSFSISVRALAESVREIPPLVYPYFDPDSGAFLSARSRPIALSVGPAALVTADDVVVAGERAGDSERSATGSRTGGAPAFSLTGANLSIVREPERLLGSRQSALGSRGVFALYAVSLAAVCLALALRWRADLPAEELARRKALRRERSRIAAAAGQPRSRAAGTIAEALRAMVRLSVGARPQELDELVAECDAVSFAPGSGGDGPVDPELQRRALALADALLEGSA